MKKNRNGFMLIETIITTTVIITSLIVLYTSFNHIYTKYETSSKYHNVDALYATKLTIDYLLKNDFNTFLNNTFENNEGIYLKRDDWDVALENSFCNSLNDLYDIQTMIFTAYDKNTLKHFRGEDKEITDENGEKKYIVEPVANETMKEYIDYVIGYYDITDSNIDNSENTNPYSYIVITEIKDGENYYYANIPIR